MNKINDIGHAALLAEAFAQQCVAWAKKTRQDPKPDNAALAPLAALARRLVLATQDGHVCLELSPQELHHANAEMGADDTSLRDTLLQTGVVANAANANGQPLILDGHRLYLARHYQAEQQLALRLTTLAASGRLCIISGGPGTGKTTTVARLLGRLLRQQPHLQIALAAPTGKAAARMMEALLSRAADLPAAIQERLPTQASTLHRLLGWHPKKAHAKHPAGNPLWLDLLIVDEASMLDLALATQLLDALASHTTLLLLGDKDQLAAVEAGAVFAEISAQPAHLPKDNDELDQTLDHCLSVLRGALERSSAELSTPPRNLSDRVIWLQTSHRFKADSTLGKLAAAVRDGQADNALSTLATFSATKSPGPSTQYQWLNDSENTLTTRAQKALLDGFQPYRFALAEWVSGQPEQRQLGISSLFAAFDRFRILAATHNGQRGTIALNQFLLPALREWTAGDTAPALRASHPSDHILGRPILILENAPATGLFNGDIGLLLPNENNTLCAYFPATTAENAGFRCLPIAVLPPHETAFALSIHKSQGSEFDNIALVFPQDFLPVLTRELLYTGLTRARHGVTVIASEQRLRDAIASPTRRDSGLAARLWQEN